MNFPKVAVMQPYLFPYIGYYQLVDKVDCFVFFDDVNYFKKGFINRNNILSGNESVQFNIPVTKASQNRHINQHYYNGDHNKFFKQLEFSYKKAPNYVDILALIEKVLLVDELNVAKVNSDSIMAVFNYLDIDKEFLYSSELSVDASLRGQDRIITICDKVKAETYINAIGGRDLYDAGDFIDRNINLNFLEPDLFDYPQQAASFVRGLSIIDALMFLDKETVREILKGGKVGC